VAGRGGDDLRATAAGPRLQSMVAFGFAFEPSKSDEIRQKPAPPRLVAAVGGRRLSPAGPRQVMERIDMPVSPASPEEKPPSGHTPDRVPKQVWLAVWFAVFGAMATAAVAIVNGGVSHATHLWSVGAPCIGIAALTAVVCYALVRYR